MKQNAIILLCVALLLLLFTYRGKSIQGTIYDFSADGAGSMIVMSKDRQRTYIVNDSARYTPDGEEWHIGDIVKIYYWGSIQETSPAVINGVNRISVIDRITLQ